MYFAPRCLFCNKNNRRRHTRRGRTWTCKFCGETNPGPGMLRAIVGRFTTPPAAPVHQVKNGKPDASAAPSAETPAAAPAAVAVATRIKSSSNGAVTKPAVVAKAKPAAKKPAPPPPPPVKKASLFDKVMGYAE